MCSKDRFRSVQARKLAALTTFLPPPRSVRQLEVYAATTLPFLSLLPYRYLHPVGLGREGHSDRAEALFGWADVIAGDFAYIRRFAPPPDTSKAG